MFVPTFPKIFHKQLFLFFLFMVCSCLHKLSERCILLYQPCILWLHFPEGKSFEAIYLLFIPNISMAFPKFISIPSAPFEITFSIELSSRLLQNHFLLPKSTKCNFPQPTLIALVNGSLKTPKGHWIFPLITGIINTLYVQVFALNSESDCKQVNRV